MPASGPATYLVNEGERIPSRLAAHEQIGKASKEHKVNRCLDKQMVLASFGFAPGAELRSIIPLSMTDFYNAGLSSRCRDSRDRSRPRHRPGHRYGRRSALAKKEDRLSPTRRGPMRKRKGSWCRARGQILMNRSKATPGRHVVAADAGGRSEKKTMRGLRVLEGLGRISDCGAMPSLRHASRREIRSITVRQPWAQGRGWKAARCW